jgi:hypothetical protein
VARKKALSRNTCFKNGSPRLLQITVNKVPCKNIFVGTLFITEIPRKPVETYFIQRKPVETYFTEI